ncbi:MAG: ribonuclease P protein component [Chthoniobacterales bacterium]
MSSSDTDEWRGLRFSKARRLTRAAEFSRVKSDGKVQRGALLILGSLDVADEHGFRAGFVTSKRVGNAVVRNRIRRRLREVVRHHQHALHSGIWMVLIARPAAARATCAALEDEWLRLAKRALILAPSCS